MIQYRDQVKRALRRALPWVAVASLVLLGAKLARDTEHAKPLWTSLPAVFTAVEVSDVQFVLSHARTEERKLLHLDHKMVSRLLAWYHSATNGCSPGALEVDKSEHQCVGDKALLCGTERSFISLQLCKYPDGVKMDVVYPIVESGILTKYASRVRADKVQFRLAMAAGYRAEANALKQAGLPGYVSYRDFKPYLVDWEVAARVHEQAAAAFQRRIQGTPSNR